MKISVVGYGSRGDVQPPLVLAHRLREAGHHVTVVVPDDFAEPARAIGDRVVLLPRGVRAALAEGTLLRSLRLGRTVRFFNEAFHHEFAHLDRIFDAVVDGMADVELVIAPALLEDACVSVAEARRQRVAVLVPTPLWANWTYPSLLFSGLDLPGWLNRLTHVITDLGLHRILRYVNPLRAKLGLAPAQKRPSWLLRRAAPPIYYWVPERVLPRPDGYGDNHHFAGYFSPTPAVRAAFGEASPPDELRRFLDAGAPPLYAGFGSMPVLEGRALEAIDRASETLGLRVVYGQGWSDAPPQNARSLTVSSADHEWLFPRCAASLHHGGASTTGAALRSGTPTVVASVFADQPFWGRRVQALGAGVTMRYRQLNATRLTRALERALSEPVRRAARALADDLSAQADGAELTARHIDAEVARFPIPPRL